MIEAKHLEKKFKAAGKKSANSIVAVRDVSFVARDGEVTGLLGANGAGKSTTLRMISGLIRPDAGTIKVDEQSGFQNGLNIRKHIGYMPHDVGLYGRLTARENITYFAQLSGMPTQSIQARIEELIQLLDMADFCDRRCEGFSQGQKTKVALARALIHSPKNIILDEPTNGLDVLATRNLREIFKRLKKQGHCILLSSHIMQEVTQTCDRVAIIEQGRIVIVDTVDQIIHKANATNFEDAFVRFIREDFKAEANA